MIPNSELIYSYRDFKPSDLYYDGFIRRQLITALDYIDLSNMDSDDITELIDSNFECFEDDFTNVDNKYGRYFLKDLCLREMYDDNTKSYTRFTISDWDDSDKIRGIDTRNLTMSTYIHNESTDVYKCIGSFKFKSFHVYQLIKDIGRKLAYLENSSLDKDNTNKITPDTLNMWILPIYVFDEYYYQEGDKICVSGINRSRRYTRISDLGYSYYKPWTFEYTYKVLHTIYSKLVMYCALNYYMISLSENDNSLSIYNYRSAKTSHTTFRSYVSKATSNQHKTVKISIKNGNHNTPVIRIDTEQENTLVTSIPRKLCDYCYQVKAHMHRYWVGSGTNKHLETRWVDSYYRNADKQYRIIKEIKE